jgi:hypothetical protein
MLSRAPVWNCVGLLPISTEPTPPAAGSPSLRRWDSYAYRSLCFPGNDRRQALRQRPSPNYS